MRRYVNNDLGRLVEFIFEETGKTPLYIDNEVAMYKWAKEFDEALALYGRIENVRITYGRGYVLLELI